MTTAAGSIAAGGPAKRGFRPEERWAAAPGQEERLLPRTVSSLSLCLLQSHAAESHLPGGDLSLMAVCPSAS
ncbi:hypothetical protein llap_6556 [Limosa lapponica baueri]|uniref:Uncharacterized protein n=1 Tax=Limosa lapponica baueri TaxID=1758121 RepID=A0A2I0UAS3_LIMLA|nr:hypothetical protein llap_6556 [Limosa lapponica baueri]